MKEDVAPLRGKSINTEHDPWEGNCKKKPWDYNVTAVIPCLDTFETIEIVIKLLQLQTERPYIMIVDTGSTGCHLEKMQQLQADDVEVHFLRLNGVEHPSDFPAMAMDAAFSACRTNYLFATHADCFLRKRTFLEELMKMCQEISPVVGYEMSPRQHADWKGMVSHTATMYDMRVMDKIYFSWSLRRLCNLFDVKNHKPDPMHPNWPDTEILGNYQLRHYKIEPHLIGHEENFVRHVDENIDHMRSYTSSKLYSPHLHFKKAKEWFKEAENEALKRIDEWSKHE